MHMRGNACRDVPLERLKVLSGGRVIAADLGRVGVRRASGASLLVFLMLTVVSLFTVRIPVAQAFTCRDKLGRTVTIRTPVKRAVLLTGADLLAVTGAWNRVVGISKVAREDNDLLKAAKPDLPALIPSVGNNNSVNTEALLKLKPDLVLSWSSNPDYVRFLAGKGFPVLAVYPESIDELYAVMRLQGRLFGREKKIEAAIGRMEKMFALIRKRMASVPPAQRKKALWISSKPTTVTGGISVNNDLLSRVGLTNLGGGIRDHSRDVSQEQIMAWNPDVLFIWGRAPYAVDDMLANPQWRHIRAVRERMVFKAPKWDTWSPRLAPLALWMAATVYPQQFRDIDVNKTIDRFYRDVFGVPYARVSRIGT